MVPEGYVVEGSGLVGISAVAIVPVEFSRRLAVGIEVDAEEKWEFSAASKV